MGFTPYSQLPANSGAHFVPSKIQVGVATIPSQKSEDVFTQDFAD
jgi:hypothetical protein